MTLVSLHTREILPVSRLLVEKLHHPYVPLIPHCWRLGNELCDERRQLDHFLLKQQGVAIDLSEVHQ